MVAVIPVCSYWITKLFIDALNLDNNVRNIIKYGICENIVLRMTVCIAFFLGQ